jgi:hypothetical protein
MRHLVIASLFATSLLAIGLSASPAAAQARYCLQGGRHWGYPGNCQFATPSVSCSRVRQGCYLRHQPKVRLCARAPRRPLAPLLMR